jgi:Uma2 family endonuclease
MVIELLAEQKPGQKPLADYLHPSADVTCEEPEERVVFSGISWDAYLALDRELGDDRPGARLYYLDGELEIISTSKKHEILKAWIGGFVEDFCFEKAIAIFPTGQATMRIVEQVGAEPDHSWSFSDEKEFRDLVLEIALTSGGIPKLGVYQRFAIPQIWFWRRGKVEAWKRRADHSGYDAASESAVLPGFDFTLCARCMAMMPKWNEARRASREALR